VAQFETQSWHLPAGADKKTTMPLYRFKKDRLSGSKQICWTLDLGSPMKNFRANRSKFAAA
jgi:hypothetical protein